MLIWQLNYVCVCMYESGSVVIVKISVGARDRIADILTNRRCGKRVTVVLALCPDCIYCEIYCLWARHDACNPTGLKRMAYVRTVVDSIRPHRMEMWTAPLSSDWTQSGYNRKEKLKIGSSVGSVPFLRLRDTTTVIQQQQQQQLTAAAQRYR
jgi:hypothetical protein